MSDQLSPDILGLTAQIVSAHVSNNRVDADGLTSLIQSVYRSLSAAGSAAQPTEAPAQTPAVPVKKSVFPDYIVCLEDGKKLKMLKRHLQTSYGLSPDAYRQVGPAGELSDGGAQLRGHALDAGQEHRVGTQAGLGSGARGGEAAGTARAGLEIVTELFPSAGVCRAAFAFLDERRLSDEAH